MSELYGTSLVTSVEEMANSNALLELFYVDDILRGTSEEIKEFCESEEAQVLVEKQVLNKPTLHRLSKIDDLKRRQKLAAYMLASSANDPLFAKLVKYQKLKKEYSNKILKKYGNKALRIAKMNQKDYIKKARAVKATAEERKNANAKA